ncbi:MAG: hypothetical protein HC908_11355 [Calothrix sp. SM1_7_51]|nr:hypothetical protein [Calothrix sp. SM1_7_51]
MFGDGNPNPNKNELRWQAIATVICNHQGVVTAEQIAPYLDDLREERTTEWEINMIPILLRFDGPT